MKRGHTKQGAGDTIINKARGLVVEDLATDMSSRHNYEQLLPLRFFSPLLSIGQDSR